MCGVRFVDPTRTMIESPAFAANPHESLAPAANVPFCVGPLGSGVCAWTISGIKDSSKSHETRWQHACAGTFIRIGRVDVSPTVDPSDATMILYELICPLAFARAGSRLITAGDAVANWLMWVLRILTAGATFDSSADHCAPSQTCSGQD